MTTWEYQVTRLNVDPPIQPASAQADMMQAQGASESESQNAVFSERYLKEEFPKFYDSSLTQPDSAKPNEPREPAFQLQDFLNLQGREGWELVGFQHAPPHVFIVMKRQIQTNKDQSQHRQLEQALSLANRALAMIERTSDSNQMG